MQGARKWKINTLKHPLKWTFVAISTANGIGHLLYDLQFQESLTVRHGDSFNRLFLCLLKVVQGWPLLLFWSRLWSFGWIKNLSYCSCRNGLLMSFSFMLLSGSRVLVFVQCPVPWGWEKVSDFFCWQGNRAQLAGKAQRWWSETVSRSEWLFRMLGWHAGWGQDRCRLQGRLTNSYLAEVLWLPLGLNRYYIMDILTKLKKAICMYV